MAWRHIFTATRISYFRWIDFYFSFHFVMSSRSVLRGCVGTELQISILFFSSLHDTRCTTNALKFSQNTKFSLAKCWVKSICSTLRQIYLGHYTPNFARNGRVLERYKKNMCAYFLLGNGVNMWILRLERRRKVVTDGNSGNNENGGLARMKGDYGETQGWWNESFSWFQRQIAAYRTKRFIRTACLYYYYYSLIN